MPAAAAPAKKYHSFNPLLNALQDLPADAAAPESQVYIAPSNVEVGKVLDFYEQVYERPDVADLFSEPLVRLDKNFQIQPAAAESWSAVPTARHGLSRSAKAWSGAMAIQSRPMTGSRPSSTAPIRRTPGTSPGISRVCSRAGTTRSPARSGIEEVGVKVGADDYELVVETVVPAPYLPAMLLYSNPLSKAGLEGTGPLYNTKPETAISSRAVHSLRVDAAARDHLRQEREVHGTLKVPVNKIQLKLVVLSTTTSRCIRTTRLISCRVHLRRHHRHAGRS